MLEMRDKVVRFIHEMYNTETGEVAAACEITAVHLDRHQRKPKRILLGSPGSR